ncbi:MAG: hypothetical protein SGI86_04780 [Deltaproteobacteria bacterium]|nr:hypothetical protein [Deltaproteobacteria bacterium]
MRTFWISVIFLGLGGLSVVAWSRLRGTQPSAVAEFAAPSENEDDLRARLARLEHLAGRSVAAAISQPSNEKPSDKDAVENETHAEPTTVKSIEDQQQEQAERNRKETEFLNENFAKQADDPAWSRGFETTLQDKISKAFPSTNDVQVECRSSLCRVAIHHVEEGGQAAFLRDFPNHVPKIAAMRLNTDGTGQTTVHIVRDGYPPPTFTAESDTSL